MVTTTGFTPFSGSIGPLSNIVGFTHRDNATYLTILQELIRFINTDQREEIQAQLDAILLQFQNTAENWAELFETFMIDVSAQIGEVTPQQFGAVLDGVDDDTVAMRDFFTFLGAFGVTGVASGTARITSPITIAYPARGFKFSGLGNGKSSFKIVADFTVQANGINFTGLHDSLLENFTIDSVGVAPMYHGIAAINAQGVTLENVDFHHWLGSAAIFYYDSGSTGICENNHFIKCRGYGYNVANNGFLHGTSNASSIDDCEIYQLNRSGTPSYGLQFKNTCTNSRITGGVVDGANAGVAFGYEGTPAFHTGNHVSGVYVKHCNNGFIGSRMSGNYVEMIVDMGLDPVSHTGINLAGNANSNVVNAMIIDPIDTSTVLDVTDDYNTITLAINKLGSDVDGFATLAEFGSSATMNQLTVSHLGNLSATSAVANAVITDAGTNNRVRFAIHANEMHTTSATGTSLLRATSPTNAQNWFQFNHATGTWAVRAAGLDSIYIDTTRVSPGRTDVQSSGDTTRKWLEVWTKNGVISESPNGTKYRVRPNDAGTAMIITAV